MVLKLFQKKKKTKFVDRGLRKVENRTNANKNFGRLFFKYKFSACFLFMAQITVSKFQIGY